MKTFVDQTAQPVFDSSGDWKPVQLVTDDVCDVVIHPSSCDDTGGGVQDELKRAQVHATGNESVDYCFGCVEC